MNQQKTNQPATPDCGQPSEAFETPYVNRLVSLQRCKTIPYGGSGVRRPDGGVNYGFTNLKHDPRLIDTIPEFARDPALKSLVSTINRENGGLFSAACLSCPVSMPRGHRRSGYVEFAINSDAGAADPTNYFSMFCAFSRFLNDRIFAQRVTFQWEICPARLVDVGADGFSATVRIDTDPFATARDALNCWQASLQALEEFLGSIPKPAGKPIYSPERR